jgi:hypothetical protein
MSLQTFRMMNDAGMPAGILLQNRRLLYANSEPNDYYWS